MMTEDKTPLAMQASNCVDQINRHRCLLDIALENLEGPLEDHEQTVTRCQILIQEFISSLDCYLDELGVTIRRLMN